MWWEQEWHVWLGLCLGVAGLIVGIGAWIYAAAARSKAKEVSEELGTFEERLNNRLNEERTVRSTPPVVVPPATFVGADGERGAFLLRNIGEGPAYNVRIVRSNIATDVIGPDRWGVIPSGGSETILLRANSDVSIDLEIEVSWDQDVSGERHTQEVVYPNRRRGML